MNPEKKCVLAYSGGLDTSAMVPWLSEQGYEVHAVLVDVGQEEDLNALCRKAVRYGAATASVRDAKPAMFERVIPLAIGLGATYEGTYRLGTALARPFIAAAQVDVAKALGGATLIHGATGKGNDQIRFEFAYRSLGPECPIVAPWKTWEFKGRQDLIDYLTSRGYIDDYVVQKDYSLDENLWHISVEGGPLEDPGEDLNIADVLANVEGRFAWKDLFPPGEPQVEIMFQAGVPVAINGQPKSLETIVSQLNHQYRRAPWAWDLLIENRFTGVKSRGVYINPAAKLLHLMADNLARTCLNKPTYDRYVQLGQDYGTLLYRGEYFSDQRKVVEGAAAPILTQLNGAVTAQIEPALHVSKIVNHQSIFTKDLATFEDSAFDHADAAGFISLSWLGNVSKPYVEETAGGTLATGSSAASDVCPAKSVHAGRLVPAGT